jgi:hypothetical protein
LERIFQDDFRKKASNILVICSSNDSSRNQRL